MPEHDLQHLDTFGDVAAEDDAVLDYFLSTNAVNKVGDGNSFLVLGRKGTGKTAIVRHFTEGHEDVLSKSLNLRGYPWNVHASRIDHGSSEIEAYVSSWRYLIAIELATLILSYDRSSLSDDGNLLRHFLKDNYGGTAPALSDILRPKRLKLSKLSFLPSVMGNQLGGIELDRNGLDHQFGLELNALSTSIMNAVIRTAQYLGITALSLHFDELDQGLSRVDEDRTRMLIGLILAAREVRRESGNAGGVINPVVYLRSDLWDDLQFSDKNKISQTLTYHLGWSSATLQDLVNKRLKKKLGPEATWDTISAPELMRGSQSKWNHILSRTFLRPRDVIKFLNVILGEAKKRSDRPTYIINKDVVAARDEYSSYLKAELDDEIRPHWANWDEALRACSALSTITFEREEFTREYNKRRSSSNVTDADEALSLLYRFSVIAYERRSGYGGTSWAFQYTDAEAGWDNAATKFKVHLGLKEYAKLRETRSGPEYVFEE